MEELLARLFFEIRSNKSDPTKVVRNADEELEKPEEKDSDTLSLDHSTSQNDLVGFQHEIETAPDISDSDSTTSKIEPTATESACAHPSNDELCDKFIHHLRENPLSLPAEYAEDDPKLAVPKISPSGITTMFSGVGPSSVDDDTFDPELRKPHQVPSGRVFRLWDPKQARYHDVESGTCVPTRGADQYMHSLEAGAPGLWYKELCCEYSETKQCAFGGHCFFIHCDAPPIAFTPAVPILYGSCMYQIPEDQMIMTCGLRCMKLNMLSSITRCHTFDFSGRCALGTLCPWAHTKCSIASMALLRKEKRPVGGSHFMQRPPGHDARAPDAALLLLPAGKFIPTYDADANCVWNIPSHEVFFTVGAFNCLREQHGPILPSSELCYAFADEKECMWWENCKFIHCVTGTPRASCEIVSHEKSVLIMAERSKAHRLQVEEEDQQKRGHHQHASDATKKTARPKTAGAARKPQTLMQLQQKQRTKKAQSSATMTSDHEMDLPDSESAHLAQVQSLLFPTPMQQAAIMHPSLSASARSSAPSVVQNIVQQSPFAHLIASTNPASSQHGIHNMPMMYPHPSTHLLKR